jgi:hypothetical protein
VDVSGHEASRDVTEPLAGENAAEQKREQANDR